MLFLLLNHHATDSPDVGQLAVIDVVDVYERLLPFPAGLSITEARARLARFGPTTLPRAAGTCWWIALGCNLVHRFAVLLWVAAVLAWMIGMSELTLAIVLVVVVNGLFSYWRSFWFMCLLCLRNFIWHRFSRSTGCCSSCSGHYSCWLKRLESLSCGTE